MPDPQRDHYLGLDVLHNRLRVSGTLVAQTALRIGSGRASDVVGNDLPVLRDGRGRPFLPGASLKGAFRARLEALIRAVAPGQALGLEAIEERTQKEVRVLKAESAEAREGDEELSRRIWVLATLIDLTFGSPELAGRLFFKDAHVDESFWFDTFEVRNGVAINRDTETVEGSLLYDYEVVPAGTRFQFALALEQAAPWQLGMVLLALRAWQNDGTQIGGFRTRGLGYVQLIELAFEYRELIPGDVDSALRLICAPETLDALGIAAPADELREADWIRAFRDELVARARKEQGHA